ncbi:hypothetical protein LVR82_19395 [Klebsiella variicola subsp. variicola]|uniref:hypothetical protein n=1 Tax=Klebsiella variicola TaxID=244366 RepID=UPI001E4AA25A|nr:hypothetical protein [Klebsiella variicola]MCD9775840.1 hypothetical protein [Klebsiella variicola subsp. variicola]
MINVKPIALEQVRWAIRACEEKRGIEFIVNCYNACIERGEMNEAFHLPAGEYRRYAVLLADLVKIERQIESILQVIEHDHAEALAMNDARNTLYVYAPGDAARDVWEHMTPIEQAVSVELRHAEALAFNAEVDEVAAADQWDEWANQHDSRKTKAQMIESDHAEALEIDSVIDHGSKLKLSAMQTIQNELMESLYLPALVRACHAEALELNAIYDRASLRFCEFYLLFSMAERAEQIDLAHLEALAMDAERSAAQ